MNDRSTMEELRSDAARQLESVIHRLQIAKLALGQSRAWSDPASDNTTLGQAERVLGEIASDLPDCEAGRTVAAQLRQIGRTM